MLALKATALVMAGTFVIGMCVAFITNELGVIFTKIAERKERKNNLNK
jgi:hypothetical protein